MTRNLLSATLVVLALSFDPPEISAAGKCASPAITNQAVDTTNGPWTCHINDANDKVAMKASATDHDQTDNYCPCQKGNRIDIAATTWAVSDGTLDAMTGETNNWKAGTGIGSKTLTVTFKDLNDGADCDDDDVVVQKTLTAFKVGVNLATSGGSSITRWEDSTDTAIGFNGTLAAKDVLTKPSQSGGANSVATWTLQTNPANTPMKYQVHAKAHAEGGSPDGRLYGVTADSDWFDSGKTSVGVSFSAGLVSFSASHDFDTDNCVALLSAGAAMGSQIHLDYTGPKLELKSSTETGPSDTKSVSHTPADATMVGQHGFSKQAEWEIYYSMTMQTDSGNWAAAEIDMKVSYGWTVTDTKPWYASP